MTLHHVLLAAILGCATLADAFSARNARNVRLYVEKQFSQEFTEGYNTLKHVGGNGPYSDRRSYGIDRDPPAGCTVDQVIVMHRHGERYPHHSDGNHIEEVLAKVFAANISHYQGDLRFLHDWTYYVPGNSYYGLETVSGPYSGLLDAYRRGTEYRARYGHLWNGSTVVPIFASDNDRIIETARHFGQGFFHFNYSSNAVIKIISESAQRGADSLTPSCLHDNDTKTCDRLNRGFLPMPQFDVAAARFNEQNPGLYLNASDAYALMDMASFELSARPFSDWINAFTLDEWVAFGYRQDLWYYYCAGPGDRNMKAVGAVFANASLTLLNEGPKSGTMFYNFAHDANVLPIFVALGILTPRDDLPLDRIVFEHPWQSGDIVPMGAHLNLERMSCNATVVSPKGVYVRIVVNEAVVPLESCQRGPGYSCSLANYTELLNARLPSFVNTCGIPSSYPQYLKFWWDYNTTTSLNYRNGSVPYQSGP